MARTCSICTSPQVRSVNASLGEGITIAALARETAFSESALRRHAAAHLMRIADLGPDATGISDLADRLRLALDDVDRVRRSALATARGDLAVKAAATAARIIGDLIQHLGIEDLSTTDALRDGQQLAQAVAHATRERPEVGRAVAAALADLQPADTATLDALTALADRIEHRRQLAATARTSTTNPN